MRRRQQDPTSPQPQLLHRHRDEGKVKVAASQSGKRRLQSQRSFAFLVVVVVVVLLVLFVYDVLQRSLGIVVLRETASLRGGNVLDPKQRRVIAIGDIHGDKDALFRALQLAKLVDSNNNGNTWIGGATTVVQIGDLLNKAESRDKQTLSYIINIEQQARAAGGKLIVTVGDHDLHNAPKLWHEIETLKEQPFPSWMHAAYVADRTLFVHGSLSKTAFDNAGGSIDEMNKDAEAWLAGKGPKPKWIGKGDGPIWSRLYSNKASDEHPDCTELSQLLDELSVDRMIVGHTIRREGISSICKERVWRIDVGLSTTETRAGKIGASEVLEIVVNYRERDNNIDDIISTTVKILSTDVKLKSWK